MTLAVTLMATGSLWAQQTYTITLKKLEKGDVTQYTRRDVNTTTVRVSVDDQVLPEQKHVEEELNTFKSTVIDTGKSRRPASQRRQYERAISKKDGNESRYVYHGKGVVIEKKGEKYVFIMDGGRELSEADATALTKEFNAKKSELDLEEAILPKKLVSVGESWKIDMKPIVADLDNSGSLRFDPNRATGTGKLTKVYRQSTRQFGVMEIKLDLPIKAMMQGDKEVAADPGSKATMTITFDACIDGSVHVGTMNMKLNVQLNATTMATEGRTKISVLVTGTMQDSRKEASK
jgi:hypothetical protein